MDFLVILLVVLLGVAIGWVAASYWAAGVYAKMLAQALGAACDNGTITPRQFDELIDHIQAV